MAARPNSPPIEPDRLDKLSEDQRRALRLVHAGYESKEIAQLVGRSPHTVDGWLRGALATLGVGSRKQAARLLVEVEGAPQRLMTQPLSVVGDAPVSLSCAALDEGTGCPDAGSIVAEPPTSWVGPGDGAGRRDALPRTERTVNDLSAGMRIAAIVAMAMLAMLAFGMLLSGLTALSKLV